MSCDPRTLILNVNDNDGARYLVTRMLTLEGFEVIEASTGGAALAVAEARQPAAVVLDIRLPDLDGFEVCRRLKSNERTSRIKVLHTSATFVTADKKVDGLESGGDGYLTQPFEAAELLATLRALLRLTYTEQELRDRADRLVEADRRKDEFLAMLAHELRNPLAVVSSALHLLDDGDLDASVRDRAHELATRQAQHLARLIDDLLDVSRVTHGKIELKPTVLDLGQLVSRAMTAIRTRTGDLRRQQFRRVLPDEPVWVQGDALRLDQIFMNLIDNASKYTDEGGTVEVTLRVAGGQAQVLVKDSGVGIAPEEIDQVFKLFAQANVPLARSRGGLGIGLTLVRTLVELHGGRVTARSDGEGCGSEFEVELPIAEAPAPIEEAPPPVVAATSRRVLLVEDTPDALETMVVLCEAFGHYVISATDGVAGVEKALWMRPDIAIIDVGLPGIDGYEVARRIRQDGRGRDLFLIALSGYGTAEHQRVAFEAGFDDYFVKPIRPAELQQLLQDVRRRASVG